jgi:anti-anti-sigma factor
MRVTTTVGPVTVLEVTGDVDTLSFRELIRAADQVIENEHHYRLVLDLSGVNYISSAGLIALQTIYGRTVAWEGLVVLCNAQPNVMKVLEMTGFAQKLRIYPDRASAVASFGAA